MTKRNVTLVFVAIAIVLLGLGFIGGLIGVLGFLTSGIDDEYAVHDTNWTGVFVSLVCMLPGTITAVAWGLIEDDKKKRRMMKENLR